MHDPGKERVLPGNISCAVVELPGMGIPEEFRELRRGRQCMTEGHEQHCDEGRVCASAGCIFYSLAFFLFSRESASRYTFLGAGHCISHPYACLNNAH